MNNLMLRQTWALIRKNLLIICIRRPISTFIRAIAIPLVIVLVVAYCKEFFASPQHWGISSPNTIRSLKDGLAASTDRNIVGFMNNGMTGGEVSSVIDSLSTTIREAGKTPKLYDNTRALALECASDTKGVSTCYGAVIFHSSPEQGTNLSTKGTWNYTIRGEGGMYGGFADITKDTNGAEVYLLPLQRAVDTEIISRSKTGNASALPESLKTVLYTDSTQATLDDSRTSNYLALCIYAFGTIFAFTLVQEVYHMTSFVASERQLGMSSLIDTMIPGGSNIRGRLVRQIATWVSFALVYFPSWLAVGIVISRVVFPKTSHGIPVGFTIFAGLAITSFSLFGASFFKKAQLSGSIMVVIALVFAILPQTLYEQTKSTSYVLSFLVPSATYTYLVTGVAIWEAANERVDMWAQPKDAELWRVNLGIHWIFLAVQTVVYPILAFFVEHLLFSTASSDRKFAQPANLQDATVTLSSFSKTYKPGILARLFKRRKDVRAVVDMSLTACRGQILCLLGPNGSGKSTTMNCIAGQHKVTAGSITIDPSGGLGYAPQNNVIWPDLTVEEHVRIFSDLKCISGVNEEIVSELVEACDLRKKLPSRAKTLSGGQMRKLQLAMMFAGGSAVCCVDEVSTGLDPISRRRIWEILLAERQRRTIIMTTHFLDEADYLADNIAIMHKGSLRAEGTSATLKNRYGNGYTIKVLDHVNLDVHLSGSFEQEGSRHQMVYRVATATLAAELVEYLESQNIKDYQISGPTMEELFLIATGDHIVSSDDSSSKEGEAATAPAVVNLPTNYDLADGRPISLVKQWYILLCKRFRILRRRYIPYCVAVAFAIVGAGVAPLLIKSFNVPMQCPLPADLIYDYDYRDDFAHQFYDSGFGSYYDYNPKYLFGPPDKVNENALAQMANIYSKNHTNYPDSYGWPNATALKNQLTLVNTLDEMIQKVRDSQSNGDGFGYYSSTTAGGLWMGEEPTLVANVQRSDGVSMLFNFFDNLLSNVPISSAYSQFASTQIPELFDFKPLIFVIYYGLIMAAYPAFFTLYPTNERISNVRSMQYSNGIRPLPLWLSHLAFDGIFVLVISVVATGLLAASTPVWFGLGYVFVILFLYGIACALLGYVLSMFAKSAVTAWFMFALGQVVFYFAYFGGLIGLQSSTAYQDLEGQLNALYFGLGIVSPVVSLERTFMIGLGQLGALCNGHSGGSIYLYGGPILYLVLQIIVLFILLLWWDSSFQLPSFRFRARTPKRDPEATEMYSTDLMSELKRLTSTNTDLRVQNVSKSFGKNLAVDNVTFGVQASEIFALLGPNGAGKSTIISMIRGDMKPSTSASAVDIAGHSILTSPIAARANLGVCPQFDSADVLTVTETLRFFAKTRGVSNIDHNVSTVISACSLEPWAHQLAQKLSGGTKRKLSLAVALVGNPRVLVLDEPSSALDANAKRNMWRCLQAIGKGRAVVLTTHSMEEADALADRIGIMSSRMLALGEREALKKRAGDAFHIHLVSQTAPRTTPQELQVMKDWIADTFPNAKVSRETQGGQIRFEVPAEGNSLVGLIRLLEQRKDGLGVEFYSVGKATLDEVFENIVRRYGDGGEGEK